MTKTMTSLCPALLLAAIAALGGCSNEEKANMDAGRPAWDHGRAQAMETYAVRSYFEESISNGSIAQHTLYPHHFMANSAQLNELGAHEIAVLASAYKVGPGKLGIRRGEESDDVYTARTKTVTAALASAGIDMKRMTIGDDVAGGPGEPADRVIALKVATIAPGAGSSASNSGGSGSGSGSGSSMPSSGSSSGSSAGVGTYK